MDLERGAGVGGSPSETEGTTDRPKTCRDRLLSNGPKMPPLLIYQWQEINLLFGWMVDVKEDMDKRVREVFRDTTPNKWTKRCRLHFQQQALENNLIYVINC